MCMFLWTPTHTPCGPQFTLVKRSRDVITPQQLAFTVLGIPHTVKTDNDPAYVSQTT